MRIPSFMAVSIVRHRMNGGGKEQILSLLLWGSVLLSSSGCSGDTAGPAQSAQTFWALQLNQHAITLSVAPPYDTLYLHATPLTAAGAAFTSGGPVRYHVLSGDTSITVDSVSGLVRAQVPSYQMGDQPVDDENASGVNAADVEARLTVNGVTLADTAVIQVTETAPGVPLETFSIQPPADSLSIYQSGQWVFVNSKTNFNVAQGNLYEYDINGQRISNLLVKVSTSDPTRAYIFTPNTYLTGQMYEVAGLQAAANVTIYASTWYYGVSRKDSLRVQVGYSHVVELVTVSETPTGSKNQELDWWPEVIDVAAPANVVFVNQASLPNNAVFDDPSMILQDTARINRYFGYFGFHFPLSSAGGVPLFFQDTLAGNAACNIAQYDGTTNQADSVCDINTFPFGAIRSIDIVRPGTYNYTNLYGHRGKIVVH